MKSRVIHFLSHSSEETFRLGEALSSALQADDVVALTGDLGSGKTVLIQGICSGLGVSDYVTSPTFTLIQEYRGRIPIYHFDFYRLDRIEEIENLGLDMYFESGGIALIEWAERGERALPTGAIRIRIERDQEAENARRITFLLPVGREMDFAETLKASSRPLEMESS